jgi:hypothetical protein
LFSNITEYRAEVAEIIRQATLLVPTTTFGNASEWLKLLLTKPIDTGEGTVIKHMLLNPKVLKVIKLIFF